MDSAARRTRYTTQEQGVGVAAKTHWDNEIVFVDAAVLMVLGRGLTLD